MNWSFRAFTIFGIEVRVHWALPLLGLAVILQWGVMTEHPGWPTLAYGTALVAGLVLSIFLHEMGHCSAARARGVRADGILLWPLGGLAYVGGSGNPWNEIWIALAGPLVNLLLAVAFLSASLLFGHRLHWQMLDLFNGWGPGAGQGWALGLCVDLFRMNLILGLFNLCVPAYPLDGGRILRGLLSMRYGFERATAACTSIAMGVAFLLGLWGLVQKEIYLLCSAVFVFSFALQERRLLSEGLLEGYGQGYSGQDGWLWYTSLETQDRPRRRRGPGFFARLRGRMAERRARQEREEEAGIRRRVDQLLEKVSQGGIGSLTPEERTFLEEASRKYQEFESRPRE